MKIFLASSNCYMLDLLYGEPKYGHSRDVHKAIKLSEPALVLSYATVTWLGKNQEAHVYSSKSGICAAFWSNYDPTYSVRVTFQNMQYDLPPWSISVLPDCRTAVYNTAGINSQTSQMKMTPVGGGLSWESYTEETPSADDSDTLSTSGLWEQINVTRDSSDYLWYMTDVSIASDEGFLKNEKEPLLTVMSAGHALHVFINGQLSGTVYGGLDNPKLIYSGNVKLRAGINKISMLSVAVGLPNVGLHFETWNAGVLGPVILSGLNEETRDLTKQRWPTRFVVGSKQPLTWYKATFDAPEGNDPLALAMRSMGKGQIWINGEGVGRHWPGYIARGNYGECNYAGLYSEKKCQTNYEQLAQRWYHVPRSWLKPSGNLLVVFEEWGGDPAGISLTRRSIVRVCADIVEGQPSLKNWHMATSGKSNNLQPKAHLWCPAGLKISDIQFASYGLPQGTCGNYHEGSCHAHKSYDAFEKNCIGQQSCSVNAVPEVFEGDPCPNTSKKLAVEAICS